MLCALSLQSGDTRNAIIESTETTVQQLIDRIDDLAKRIAEEESALQRETQELLDQGLL